MKIVVTGGAGFIGSHVVECFDDYGHEVIVIDNFSTGKKENLSPHMKVYNANIENKEEIEHIIAIEKPDIISHHAAQINVRTSFDYPEIDAMTNIIGSINLAEAAQKNGVKKFLFASSAGVYGDAKTFPTPESSFKKPPNPYAIGKSTFEDYLQYYQKKYGLQYGIMRYSNVYGPRQNAHGEAGVICIFINAMLQKKTPIVFGDGAQTRDFIFVKDIARANLELSKTLETSELVNVATQRDVSIAYVFEILQKLCDFHAAPHFHDSLIGEILKSQLNTDTFAHRWKAQKTIEEGLEETVQYFKNMLS